MTKPLEQESVACETKQESMDVELQCNTMNDGHGTPEYDDPDLLMFLRKKKNLFEHAFLEHSTLTLSGIFPEDQNFLRQLVRLQKFFNPNQPHSITQSKIHSGPRQRGFPHQ